MNVLTITGRLGRDAETRHVGGTAVCNFTIANDIGYGDKKQTQWIQCALWGKRAEAALPQYLVKGAQVCVSGEVSLNEFQRRDGTNGAALQVRVQDLDLIGGKASGATGGGSSSAPAQETADDGGAGFDDSIPFTPLPSHPFI